VLNNTLDVTAAPCGAAFPGAGSPWTMLQATGLSAVGMNHVRTPFPVPVVLAADARLAAFGQIPAMTQKQLEVAPVTGLLTATNRKHNVYKTRVNAGGDGASGPHPEREPA
jgi:hypothetical protein